MKILIKTLLYRFLSFILQFTILYLLTKNINKSLDFSIVIEISKIFLYYGYEKLWAIK